MTVIPMPNRTPDERFADLEKRILAVAVDNGEQQRRHELRIADLEKRLNEASPIIVHTPPAPPATVIIQERAPMDKPTPFYRRTWFGILFVVVILCYFALFVATP